jgi:hypothetical protein
VRSKQKVVLRILVVCCLLFDGYCLPALPAKHKAEDYAIHTCKAEEKERSNYILL